MKNSDKEIRLYPESAKNKHSLRKHKKVKNVIKHISKDRLDPEFAKVLDEEWSELLYEESGRD